MDSHGLCLTSSRIVAVALGLKPDGVPAKKSGCCALCGVDIHDGDLCAPAQFGPGFMDDLSLACRGSPVICGDCAVLIGNDGLRASGYGAFSFDGALPFRKWADIAAVLREPPKPPFVLTYATANNQHMAWRARVNLSRDLFYVRVGLRDLRIRRKALLDAVDASARIAGHLGIAPTEKSLANPFATLSSDLKDAHGAFRLKPEQLVQVEAECAGDLHFLRTLSLGETWGLRFLLSPGAGAS